MVCGLNTERLGSNGSSAENCVMGGADLPGLQWCLARGVRVEKSVLPCEKCCSRALVGTQKEANFFFCDACTYILTEAPVCTVQQDLYGSTGVESCCLHIEIRLNKGKS